MTILILECSRECPSLDKSLLPRLLGRTENMKKKIVELYQEYLRALDKANEDAGLIMGRCQPSFEGFMYYLQYGYI